MFTPEVNLTYLDGSNPKCYAVTVKVDVLETSGEKLVECRLVPNSADANHNVLLEINTCSGSNGNEELRIELGAISLDESLDTVEVNLIDNQQSIVGNKKVRAAEAQKESRPIGNSK